MDYLGVIRQESDRFYDTAAAADPTAGVPCCPEWNIADLVWHLGEVHFFWAKLIELRAADPDDVEKVKPGRPSEYADLVTWGRAQVDFLLGTLEATADDVAVWTWALNDADHTVGFIRRHQVQEAAVHRWDMQASASSIPPDAIAPDAAADSIDEFFAMQVPWVIAPDKPLPGSVHVHCTDADGEWVLHPDGRVERVHEKGAVALRGTASDLLLALYKRIPVDVLDVVGDDALARHFVERVNTE
ncbi:MAG: maleylpyruvate isomerase N-terminal domain-containing protein [Actinobacteria bacterium]|nr:maleylpyruvate isomerase N-terminal domain-containing protein [Actinomycetota bacterium]MBV9254491.1 maleylpyruvate isomerase N-terminal domain-containing protein [Actinomycetota bacterium]MBV9666081.1 maleylpyruvate isomerase N-terminal domain-containing protein [Actinomycetota bacterium]MBV9934915.1 maleylpyruvate isomerase N-terminal domain-containing protein [Actinomycetota bacterium]